MRSVKGENRYLDLRLEDPDRDLELDLVPDLPLFLFFLSWQRNILCFWKTFHISCSPFYSFGLSCQLECIAIVPRQQRLLFLQWGLVEAWNIKLLLCFAPQTAGYTAVLVSAILCQIVTARVLQQTLKIFWIKNKIQREVHPDILKFKIDFLSVENCDIININ